MCGSPGTPGAGPRPRRLGEADTQVPGLSPPKSIFSFKHVFKNRENQTKPQGISALPRASPTTVSFNSPFPPLFGFVFPPLSTYTGGGVWLGWGALGVRLLLGWGLLLPFSPPLRLVSALGLAVLTTTQPPPLPPGCPSSTPKCLCLSRFVCCWFFFGFGFGSVLFSFSFFTVLRSFCSRRSYYILLRKWGKKNQEATVPL